MEQHRRLGDQIITAHEQACEEGKKDVANNLLQALELDLSAIGGSHPEHRKATEQIGAAFALQEQTFSS